MTKREMHLRYYYERGGREKQLARQKAERQAPGGRAADRRYNLSIKRKKSLARWQAKNPEKVKAAIIVYRALAKGLLERPDNCSKCGRLCKPQAHHADYTYPLEVTWLCIPCHRELH